MRIRKAIKSIWKLPVLLSGKGKSPFFCLYLSFWLYNPGQFILIPERSFITNNIYFFCLLTIVHIKSTKGRLQENIT